MRRIGFEWLVQSRKGGMKRNGDLVEYLFCYMVGNFRPDPPLLLEQKTEIGEVATASSKAKRVPWDNHNCTLPIFFLLFYIPIFVYILPFMGSFFYIIYVLKFLTLNS